MLDNKIALLIHHIYLHKKRNKIKNVTSLVRLNLISIFICYSKKFISAHSQSHLTNIVLINALSGFNLKVQHWNLYSTNDLNELDFGWKYFILIALIWNYNTIHIWFNYEVQDQKDFLIASKDIFTFEDVILSLYGHLKRDWREKTSCMVHEVKSVRRSLLDWFRFWCRFRASSLSFIFEIYAWKSKRKETRLATHWKY